MSPSIYEAPSCVGTLAREDSEIGDAGRAYSEAAASGTRRLGPTCLPAGQRRSRPAENHLRSISLYMQVGSHKSDGGARIEACSSGRRQCSDSRGCLSRGNRVGAPLDSDFAWRTRTVRPGEFAVAPR